MSYVNFFSDGILYLILYGIEASSPAIAAVVSVFITNGKKGIIEFLKDKYIKYFSVKLALIGFAVPAFVYTVAKLVCILTSYNNPFIILPSLNKLLVISWSLISEELGWRGFLQNKIEIKFGRNTTPIIIGLLWSAWHYHFFLSGTITVPIVIFILGCICESYGYYVITKISKGNIVPASLWHFSGNLFINIYSLNPDCNGGSVVPYILLNSFMIIYILIFIVYSSKLKVKS